MSFTATFKEGFSLGLESIKLVWRHKKLVWYILIAGLAQAALSPLAPRDTAVQTDVVQENVDMQPMEEETVVVQTGNSCTTASCISFTIILSLIASALTSLATLLCTIALARHTLRIIRNQSGGTIRENLQGALSSWRTVLAWIGINWALLAVAALVLGVSLAGLLMAGSGWSTAFNVGLGILGLIFAVIIIAWNILTLFVPVVIAAEPRGIVAIIRTSAHLVKHVIVQLFGGYCLGVLVLLALVPLVALVAAVAYVASNTIAMIVGIAVAPIVLLAVFVLSTAYTVFLTMIYARNRTGTAGHDTILPEPPYFRVP